MTIGQNIKFYRKEQGLTQRELAEILGVSVQAVSKWETDMGAPDISLIVPLATALDVSTDALFDYEHHIHPVDFHKLQNDYNPYDVFRDRRNSGQNYKTLYEYFSAHPQNSEAAALCLKCLVDMIVAGKVIDKSKSELIAECEKYANCVIKYETDADTVFMVHFILSRGYSALGEDEKSKGVLAKIPVTFGDKLYWEAEIAQANKNYDTAMLKCRESFALKARYISRCIRMAAEICEIEGTSEGIAKGLEYREYMLRIIDTFLSGGEYLPWRQIMQKYSLLQGMVRQYILLGNMKRALECAELVFKGKEEYIGFLKDRQKHTTLLFENNDSAKSQSNTIIHIENCIRNAVEYLKNSKDFENNADIKALFQKYEIV